ncbi:DedA family protein [Bacillus thuringiensis]|uniref:DedA family protein n=1 Tax=Bacillus cereus group TaxID=86661 RepID=UPI00034BC74B|nr:DedA family protein [Bacillus thuringiensis]MCH5449908.1 DedA family protein [Bacillus cereus]MCU5187183.1 DedA family protein [Bacillus cereus]
MEQQLGELIVQYGYLGILIALVGGIVGLPIPDEFLLTFVGYNVSKGTMSGGYAILSGMAGAIIGITLSYILGLKLGLPILNKYGPKIHINEKQIDKTHVLFEKYGPFLLIIGYFIPGIRHLTAYFAGMSNLTYWRFCLYAYGGAFIWTSTFIGIGWKLGDKWGFVEYSLHHYGIRILTIFVVFIFFILLYFKRTKKW